MSDVLQYKWSVSKGRNTFGYNICTLYVNGKKAARCNGGGYDMQGTCLAQYMRTRFEKELKGLVGNNGSGDDGTGYYGLNFYGPKPAYERHKTYQEGDSISLDGACGHESMVSILNALGYRMKYIFETRKERLYTLEVSK